MTSGCFFLPFRYFFSFLSSPKKWNMLYCYGSVDACGGIHVNPMVCIGFTGGQQNRMRENMSEESNRTSAARRKRVQTLKKLILLMLMIFIIVPIVCCAVLFVKMHGLNRKLGTVTLQLEEMSRLLEEKTLKEEVLRQQEIPKTGETPAGSVSGNDSESPGIEDENSITDVIYEGKRKVYLTFDDGPSMYTDDILDILDQYDVKATFFVVGKEDEKSREALQEIVRRGHSLGMHSYGHKYKELYESVESFGEDFEKLQRYLQEVTGVKCRLYRFPGGSSNTVSSVDMHEFADYLTQQDVIFYDWNISSGDGGKRLLPAEELIGNSTKDIGKWDTSIILLHDSAEKKTTVEALPAIIENILALEDTVILPITEETEPVQHIHNENTKVKE